VTLHSYLALALFARSMGTRVVIEFHETQDVGEAHHVLAHRYVGRLAPFLFRRATHYIGHSTEERTAISETYNIDTADISVIPHASYGHYQNGARKRDHGDCNLLIFGVIRPFKGVEDLVRAFEMLADEDPTRYRLTVVGETWEGWTLPAELIAASRHADRITFVNRYVTDEEVDGFFANADIVVLPYHRSSQSGPLHVAMGYGLPVVVTAVGGLIESVKDYEGAVLVPPKDPGALAAGIARAQKLTGRCYGAPVDWRDSAKRHLDALQLSRRAPIKIAATPRAPKEHARGGREPCEERRADPAGRRGDEANLGTDVAGKAKGIPV
jgi:glycosyltransferase involved in cell wall biosynthesis